MNANCRVHAEYPRFGAGRFSSFPTWRLGFEHHRHLQDRWYAGVAPTVRFDVHSNVALQVSLGASAAHLRSLWTPYRFDSSTRTWSKAESEAKWAWLFDVDATVWFNIDAQLGLGLNYGVGAIYPFAPANDVLALPLTRLGIYGRWVYEV